MISLPLMPDVSLKADIPYYVREWRNEYSVRKWCRQFTLISEQEQEAWMRRIANDPTIKMFSVVGDKEVVGVCGLTSIDRVNQKAEFSLYIAPKFQGKGYGHSALLLLLMHGFWDQNLNRIWGESFDGNPAQKIFSYLGMWREGTQKEAYFRDGKFVDSHIWAMTREQFNDLYLDRLSNRVQPNRVDAEPRSGGGKPANSQSNSEFEARIQHIRDWCAGKRDVSISQKPPVIYTGKASSQIGW